MAWWKWWKRALPPHGKSPKARTKDHADFDQPTVGIDGKDIGLDGFYVGTESEALLRAEAAMLGTASIPRILTLVPPQIDPDLDSTRFRIESRDFGPDRIAEYSLAFPARGVFAVDPLRLAITPELNRSFAEPELYVRTPKGQVTFMISGNAPKEAIAIIAGWTLRELHENAVQKIHGGAHGLAAWLGTRPEGFAIVEPDVVAIAAQHKMARRIIEIEPNDVAIMALPKEPNRRFDGKTVWRTLHALGLRWGDMDQFQWRDPTDQTDYLFWAEVDDGRLGYALPEEIAAGRQHFESVRFTFNIKRTPHPAHVLGQMASAAETFAKELDCQLAAVVDRSPVDGLRALEAAVHAVVGKLEACGMKPAARSVCMLH